MPLIIQSVKRRREYLKRKLKNFESFNIKIKEIRSKILRNYLKTTKRAHIWLLRGCFLGRMKQIGHLMAEYRTATKSRVKRAKSKSTPSSLSSSFAMDFTAKFSKKQRLSKKNMKMVQFIDQALKEIFFSVLKDHKFITKAPESEFGPYSNKKAFHSQNFIVMKSQKSLAFKMLSRDFEKMRSLFFVKIQELVMDRVVKWRIYHKMMEFKEDNTKHVLAIKNEFFPVFAQSVWSSFYFLGTVEKKKRKEKRKATKDRIKQRERRKRIAKIKCRTGGDRDESRLAFNMVEFKTSKKNNF